MMRKKQEKILKVYEDEEKVSSLFSMDYCMCCNKYITKVDDLLNVFYCNTWIIGNFHD